MQENNKNSSLYEYIKAHMEQGRLPENFMLPKEEEEGKLRFADGAIDGICIYHMMGSNWNEQEEAELQQLVQLISDGKTEEADVCLREFAKKNRALPLIDTFENYIRENSKKLNTENFYQYGVKLITEAKDTESVKYGLELLELFVISNTAVKDIIRTLGLSDEFTLFVLFIMQQWENANEEIFALAQKVFGWGRIHAVEKLVPATQEIRDWLLKEGIHNKIMPEYSALTCFEKAEAAKLLTGTLKRETYQAIGVLLEAMLNEGPVPGISAVTDRSKVLLDFLAHSRTLASGQEDYQVIKKIYEYAAGEKTRDEAVCKACRELLDSDGNV